jgi:hypothetical protein
MSIHLKDTISVAEDIELRKRRRRAVKNVIDKLRAFGLREIIWKDNSPGDEVRGIGPGGKIHLVTSKWDDRQGKRK